jgi:heme/copper-type cytochrome/quinol oxidase subunit 2
MNCSEIQIQTIKYVSLAYLSLFLFIIGLLNIRKTSPQDDEKTREISNSINICSSIIIFLCFLVLLRCIFFFYMTRSGDSQYQEIDIVNKVLIFIFPFTMLIVSIIQKIYVSNYLPNMNNKEEVDKFNKNHTINANVLDSSNNTLLVISSVLFLLSLYYSYITSKGR